MVTDFIGAVRDCLKSGGFAKKSDEVEEGGTFLVGYAGKLFMIADDYQVGDPVDGFAACGCGDLVALGSLRSTRTWTDPVARVKEALECAETFSAGVRGPFHVETL